MAVQDRRFRMMGTAALLLAMTTLGACSDLPTSPEGVAAGAGASVLAAPRLSGTYEAPVAITLANGAVLYRVGVYFGTEQDTPTAKYLVQVGVRTAGRAQLTLHQDSYVVNGESVVFVGGVLSAATLRGDVLEATLEAAGERVTVRLTRGAAPPS